MIILKGSPKGISVSVDDTDIETGKKELAEKLFASKEFFKDIELDVYLTSNFLTELEVLELRPAVISALSETKVKFIDEEPKMIPKKHSPLDDLSYDEGVTKFLRQTVKSGESVEYDNNIVIIGDVEAGAKVTAGGNVFVLGTLFGTVHAGADGRRDAAVVAMKLMPDKLMIADMTAAVEHSTIKKLFSNTPEIAYIYKDLIKIEQYTEK